MAAITRWRPKSRVIPIVPSPSSFSSSSPISPNPNEPFDETLVSAAISILKHHRSRARWSQLKSLLPPAGIPSAAVFHILVALRNRPHLAHSFFLFSRRRDLLSISAAAHIAARSRRRAVALRLLRDAVRLHEPAAILETLARTYRACDSAPFVFDLIITAYLDAKKLDRAVHIVRLLRSRGIRPLISTSNSLIRSTSRINGSDAGFELYRELFGSDNIRTAPNIQIFNTLLLGFYQEGKLDRAGGIRVEMERFKVDPNVFTYSILIAGLCDEGRIRQARQLWDEMAGKRIKPDIMAFNTLINGYCKSGDTLSAEQLLRDMVIDEIQPTCTTYEYLIKGHCLVGDLDAAMLVYKDMKRKGFGPQAGIVDQMLDEMRERGRVDEGLRLLREEMHREGFSPGRRSYEAVIAGFCEKGEMETALKLQAEMAGRGFAPDEKVYDAFLKGYRKQGDVEKEMKLCEEMRGMGLQVEGV